ncbi:glutaredoxin [Pontibacter sp. E15-1]|uniref:glutaredoxin n=1 Tax=Pontibacter sp. E15-1 TaxID=2919918 RepID=UPI001F4F6FD6|nr:glutaredoxin [Pontibacter sp. E15-1]MCJ8163274.1 glutaredoxin [Pontibacter sp. E15-1]
MKRKVEIFTAGCPVCEPVVQMVKDLTCDSCDVTVYNMAEMCDDKSCLAKAKAYGVVRMPAVAVDGKLLNCCQNNAITKEELISAGIGQN